MPEWVWGVLDIWAASRVPSPMGGLFKHLPGAGGAGDQPAALTDALAYIDGLVTARNASA